MAFCTPVKIFQLQAASQQRLAWKIHALYLLGNVVARVVGELDVRCEFFVWAGTKVYRNENHKMKNATEVNKPWTVSIKSS